MTFQKQLEIREHASSVYSIAYDNKFLYSGSSDKCVARWNLETGTQDKFAIKFDYSVYAIECAKNLLFVGLASGDLHVFDLDSRKELKHFTQHRKAIFSITIDPTLEKVVVGDADGNISVWKMNSLELMIYLPLDCGKIRDIAFDSNGKQFALACQDGTIRVFDTVNFNELRTIEAHKDGVTSLLWQGEYLISGGKDAYLRKWDISKEEMVVSVPAHNFAVYRILTVNDLIITASRDKTVKIWDQDLSIIKRLDAKEGGHSHSVNDLCKIEDLRFASCGDDRRIVTWLVFN